MIYVGRFAPSPTGPLHAGSLVAALASWLDARAAGGRWLVRIEDVDTPRNVAGADRVILGQLAACGLHPDEPPVRQSTRSAAYEQALQKLVDAGWAYPCACSRKDVADALVARGIARSRHGELVYPGTCRSGLHGRTARAMRMLCAPSPARPDDDLVIEWTDRRLGPQRRNVTREVGDFVLKRADGPWAYQLAVVVDDAWQGVTHVVRGADLADNTPRQIHLQRALGVPTPSYLHTPLVLAADGQKLSKQNGAQALDIANPLAALHDAGATLGLSIRASDGATWLEHAVRRWREMAAVTGFAPASSQVVEHPGE
ncbi:MAG: tRNA glutamyl-Q(34) synthetase GluQRS [Proteobacteria bacterium]|nr:tRNA glutamyl-Q(34) synthetase GluQRS [Pseudomonadota bacterium]